MKLLELHETDQDYRAIFDLFDDLVILDRAQDPQRIRFYQIKSKGNGSWSLKDLTKAKKDEQPPSSTLGKMYSNVMLFGSSVDRICFVSNAPYLIKLSDSSTTTQDHVFLEAVHFHSDEATLLDAKLDADFPPPRAISCISILCLERTSLGIRDQSALVVGKLTEFFENQGQHNLAVTAVYKCLLEEVREKTRYTDEISSLDQLYKYKSLAKADVSKVFARAATEPRFLQDWSIIENELTNLGVGTIEMIKLKTACIDYCRRRAAGDPTVVSLSDQVQSKLGDQQALIKKSETVFKIVQHTEGKFAVPADDLAARQLRAALMVEIHEAIHA